MQYHKTWLLWESDSTLVSRQVFELEKTLQIILSTYLKKYFTTPKSLPITSVCHHYETVCKTSVFIQIKAHSGLSSSTRQWKVVLN